MAMGFSWYRLLTVSQAQSSNRQCDANVPANLLGFNSAGQVGETHHILGVNTFTGSIKQQPSGEINIKSFSTNTTIVTGSTTSIPAVRLLIRFYWPYCRGQPPVGVPLPAFG